MDSDRERDRFARVFADERLPGKILIAEDVAERPGSREVVVGRVPTLEHLRDGCFFERPDLVAAALAALDQMVQDLEPSSRYLLPVLILQGDSGCGKKVLLLQLLRELVENRGWPVIWLGDRAEDLLPLLEAWPRLGSIFPGIVAVDDLYGDQSRVRRDPGLLAQAVRNCQADLPLILTSGPGPPRVENNRYFSRDVRWRLPATTLPETQQIRAWFARRTGAEPKPSSRTARGADEASSMVFLLFEMRFGDLESFARILAEKASQLELAEKLLPVLALNRLELWAPAAWLGPEDLQKLDQLNADEDLGLFQADRSREGLLRLTHPGLADALLQAWRPEPSGQVQELGRAFEKAFESPTEVWKLVLWAPQVRADAKATRHLIGVCAAWLERHADQPAWPSVWAELRRFRFQFPADPLVTRASALGIPWLRGHYDHPDWLRVWADLDHELQKSAAPAARDLCSTLGPWLRIPHHRRENYWVGYLQIYLDAGLTEDDVVELGAQWCLSHPDPKPGLVAKILVHRLDLPEFGGLAGQLADWLEKNQKSEMASQIRSLFGDRLEVARVRSEPWVRLAKVIAMLQARSRKFEQLQVNVKSGEAVPGRIVGRREAGYSVELEMVEAYLPDRSLGTPAADSWVGWQGQFRIEAVYPVKQVVIVKRDVGKTPWYEFWKDQ